MDSYHSPASSSTLHVLVGVVATAHVPLDVWQSPPPSLLAAASHASLVLDSHPSLVSSSTLYVYVDIVATAHGLLNTCRAPSAPPQQSARRRV